MALPTPTFIAGLFLLAYLLSFVLFAFIRVVTGVSIQRIGISGLRRIAFTPKDGCRIELRGLGLTLHRPTLAQPTWVSVVLSELKVTVDLQKLGEKPRKKQGWAHWANGHAKKVRSRNATPEESADEDETDNGSGEEAPRSKTWARLTAAKERIKRLHRKINYIRLVDLVATSATCVIVDVGSIQVGSFTMAVDTRRKTVDRSRLFNHHKPTNNKEHRPAEWIMAMRSVFFAPEGKESTEVLDHCSLNIHGMLYKELDGLRDASIALKLGRLSIPYDDVETSLERARKRRSTPLRRTANLSQSDISLRDVMEELEHPGSREDDLVQTVSDSKEFAGSVLRGIQEFQFAIGSLGLTKQIYTGHSTESPVYLNMSMKEVGMDLLRLDPKSPAHLMYFSRDDIAHQALLAGISISVGIDDGHGHPERLLYIPMVTTTLNTTLPSKTIQYSREKNIADRNANILYANLVITSPSLDLDPKHMPLLVAMLQGYESKRHTPKRQQNRRRVLRRLLPKAVIKTSIHEPVIRVTLPPMEPDKKGTDEFDLLISSSSSVSLDIESSHAADGDLHYALISTFRMNSQQLYYQTASSDKHNLLITDFLEVKLQLTAAPEVVVVINGIAQTFSVYLVRPEISEGLRQIVSQMETGVRKRRGVSKSKGLNFLRRLPSWLSQVNLQGSDFNLEVADTDREVSKHARGVGLHLENWTAEYRQEKAEKSEPRPTRRRAPSRTISRDEYLLRPSSPSSPKSPRRTPDSTDGRRLALHWQGLEGFVLEAADTWEQDPFLSLPRMEVAFTTSSDKQGPIFHVHAFLQTMYFHYSLYRHFACGVAGMMLRRSFNFDPQTRKERASRPTSTTPQHLEVPSPTGEEMNTSGLSQEVVTLDVKAHFIQIKADMPSDPPLMLHIYGLEAGRHRWSSPFLRSRLVRLYVESPHVKRVWARIISIKSLRLDYRQSKRRYGNTITDDKSFDISTDAIRIAVPHQLVPHKIFDNITNVAKTVKQLHHRFKTGTNEYILDKEPEGPKYVPKINLRSRAVMFEIEDGSFEWKLGVIYRYGLMEQKQRLAREHAFDLKVKRLWQEDDRLGGSRQRTRSAHTQDRRGRSKLKKQKNTKTRSQSEDRYHSDGSNGRHAHDHPMRYDKDGVCTGLSGTSKTSVEDAREKLNRLNAQTWRKRIDHALSCQSHGINDIRSIFWGLDDMPEEADHKETILAVPQRPALMVFVVSDLNLTVDKPSFPLSDYPKFLHHMGKGMPYDMQYSLLIPMHVQLNTGEAKIQLRDYPLPLIHIPAVRASQPSRLPSLSLRTDFVIAEEFRDIESSRVCRTVVVPEEETESGEPTGGFFVDVRRTVAPVKTYSDMAIDINSAYPTRITWGTSYQPVIQDMMQVIESFTKQAIDPSERVGFWDKIRLTFHSRMKVSWKGDGDVHLILKGSRDPYMVTGHGAGFVMCWQNDVKLSIAEDQDPRNFMMVDSGSYVLAIPDLGHYARQEEDLEMSGHLDKTSSISSYKQLAIFKKTIMKLNGNVRWIAGLVFERNLDQGGRSFEFIPHYDIVLKHPKYAKSKDGKEYDAFRGFRSHHIHMSVAISAPYDREWSVSNLEPSKTYNSVHLSPRFFTHFYNWWSMFSGVMSLPIRQGKLWPGVEKSSKKFGRHLATIKYNLLLSPLYMSHVYKHKDIEEYDSNTVASTGLKVRVDSFMLDLHQRREEFRTIVQAPKSHEDDKQNQTTGMRINQVQLDLIKTDVRAVSASIKGTNPEEVRAASPEVVAGYNQGHVKADLSKFTIPDNDWGWVDMDDFVELGWILPAEQNPETKILPLAFAPRFTYFRQTDHADNISGDAHRTSHFGNEPTHHCVMSTRNDPRRVQTHLIEQRIERVREQMEHNQRAIGEQELRIVRSPEEHKHRERLEMLRNHAAVLKRKEDFLQSMHQSLIDRLREGTDIRAVPEPKQEEEDEYFEAREEYDQPDPDTKGTEQAPAAKTISDFNNRFIVHNIHLKYSNSLRNIIWRYGHQVSQRRGFVYYMSRRAVKFILDIVEEQNQSRQSSGDNPDSAAASSGISFSQQEDDELSIHERVQQLLEDGKKFVNANDPDQDGGSQHAQKNTGGDEIAVDYVPLNTYIVRLIAPQIQLLSEKNKRAAALITAKSIQMRIVQIMDKDNIQDDVSGLVQRRYSAAMDSLQIFVTNSQIFSPEDNHMYSGSTYGTPRGTAWPPWVPFEVMFEFHTQPYGFQRVVQRTSASARLDKYNNLRLKYNDDVSAGDGKSAKSPENFESRMDHIWVDFPQVRALCNSRQYYALYVIVLDLLLYTEPMGKARSERLEKIMLASDFSDLTGAPSLVTSLQERIRQLEEIKNVFSINEKYLDKQGWNDRIEVEKDLAIFEDELFFVMKAIMTAQRKSDDRTQTNQSAGVQRWYLSASDIVWHLVREGQESLAEFQLKNAVFDRTDNNDGSNLNSMEIEQITGLNLLTNAIYPKMISPYIENDRPLTASRDTKMIRVHWVKLEPIAGIGVMDHFEVNAFPLKLQLEYDIGKKLFEYVFPGIKDANGESTNSSPFQVKNKAPDSGEEENDTKSLASASTQSMNSSVHESEADTDALKLRLTPTLHLPESQAKSNQKTRASNERRPTVHHLRLFRDMHSSRSGTDMRKTLHPSSAAAANDSGSLSSRPSSIRSSSNLSVATTDSTQTARKFNIHRNTSNDKRSAKKERSDDLTQMLSRASNYSTYSYVKIPSLVLCLSYKGKGQRNFEDVYDLVFRMPTLEYRNKTWSNLDLALQLKKDVIRALISHAGAIVGNKFSHHRPSKQTQSRLRQIANSSAMLNTSPDLSGTDSNSFRDPSPGSDASGELPPRRSFTSGRGSVFSNISEESSMRSGRAGSDVTGTPSLIGGSWHDDGMVEDGRGFADELSRVDQTEPDHANMIHSLSRHITGSFGHRPRQSSVANHGGSVKDSSSLAGEDSEDGAKRKTKILLGNAKKLWARSDPSHKS